MAETTVLDPPAEVADPPASTPDPELTLAEAPPQELTPVDQNLETPAPREEAPPKAVAELAPQEQEAELRSLTEKGNKEGLKADELTRRDQLNQAVTMRRETQERAFRDAQARTVREVETIKQLGQTTLDGIFGDLKDETEAAYQRGRDIDLVLLGEKAAMKFAAFQEKARDTVLEPIAHEMRQSLLKSFGESPENLRALQGMDMGQL